MNIGIFVFIDLEYNKVLAEKISGKYVYEWVIDKCKFLNEQIVVLTTTGNKNAPVIDFVQRNGIDAYVGEKELVEEGFNSYAYGVTPAGGKEDGIMQFYIDAAKKYKIDTIIKLNGGALFFDIDIARAMLDFHIKERYEYTEISQKYNFVQGVFPEIVNSDILIKTVRQESYFKYRRGESLDLISHPEAAFVRKGFYILNDGTLKKPFVNLYIDFKWKAAFAREIFSEADAPLFDLKTALGRLSSYFSFPRHIIVEPSRECMLNCFMCPRRDLKAQNGELTFDMFVNIAEQVKDKSTVIEFSGYGEPLLNNSLPEMVAYAKSQGLKTVVYSALTANIKFIKKVIDAGLDLLLVNLLNFDAKESLDLYNAQPYLVLYHNLNKLLELKKNQKFNLGISTVLNNNNRDSILQLYKKLKNEAEVVSVKNMFEFFGKIKGYETEDFSPDNRQPCKKLLNQFFIEFDGRTDMCYYRVFDEKAKNRLQDYSIEQIWNNSALSQNRNNQLNYNFDKDAYCKKCKEWYNA